MSLEQQLRINRSSDASPRALPPQSAGRDASMPSGPAVERDPWWNRLVLMLLRPVLWLGYRLLARMSVEGAEHVPRGGPVILAPNHLSAADWPAVGLASPRLPWFMAKEELFDTPILGPLIRLCHAYPVKRDTPDRATLRWTEKLLRNGQVVVIFPEGEVSPKAQFQPLKPGLALLALRTGAPVIPVGLIGTERLIPYGHYLPRPLREPLIVRFGPPLLLDDLREPGRVVPSRTAIDVATGRLSAAIRNLIEEDGTVAPQEFTRSK
jgi:1-acyl-sn-glycerol-3-phosphate acyltransferase